MLSEQLRVEIQRNIAASLAEDIGTGDLTARQQAIDTLLQPLRQQLGEFRTRIDTVSEATTSPLRKMWSLGSSTSQSAT